MAISIGPILVVEDIASVREMVQAQLRLRGYQVVTARDGQEALELLESISPSVIITDILMPRMDGFALAYWLRRSQRTCQIPIIILSATYVSAEDERFALSLGAMRFLPKPVDVDELIIAVADALTGQPQDMTPMSEREFYSGYRLRLEAKLRQKNGQVDRSQQQMANLPVHQRGTHHQLLQEAREHRQEIQNELAALNQVLANLE